MEKETKTRLVVLYFLAFLIWVPNRYSTASTQQLEMVEKIPFFYGCGFGPFVVTSLLESRRRIENNEITTKIDWFIHYFEKKFSLIIEFFFFFSLKT